MSGDLSLSNALGGLRIANPDNEQAVGSPISPASTVSPLNSPPPHPPSQQSHSTGEAPPAAANPSRLPPLSRESSGSLGWSPSSYTFQNGDASPASPFHSQSPATPGTEFPLHQQRLSHRKSVPLNQQTPQQWQPSSQPPAHAQQYRNPGTSNPSMQPSNDVYQQTNVSSTSTGSHRYREEQTQSDVGAYDSMRPGVRPPNGMAGGIPMRNGSRTYKPTGRPIDGGSGALPPQRPSHRARGPSTSSITAIDAAAAAYAASAPQPSNADEWREHGAAVGTRTETDASGKAHTKTVKKGVKDFSFGRTLGDGSYSTVLAATDRQTMKEYAVKVLDKRHIIKEKKVKYVNIERDTLNRLTEHPGIVRLYYTFQDERSLYFVLDLASGGELLSTLKKMGTFDVECTRFYGAQILDSIAYMHSRGVIHRDLKPENVLLDRDMHTKITDFGTAKILPDPKPQGAGNDMVPGNPTDGADQDRANSFVGTAEYVSPELLQRANACKASDLWAFGCIIYQLLAGRPPFKAANEYLTFQKILNLEYTFPDGFPPLARDLVERLLVLDPANRLPVEHIRNHPFFEGVQWGKGLWRQSAPKLRSYVPPPSDPIKLNGAGSGLPPAMQAASPPQIPRSNQLRDLRGVTDLPPPSQLDIDWSPVLQNNERIMKLGNLILTVSHSTHSFSAKNGDSAAAPEKTKLRSFFSGNANKRRERLVLITSNARLVVAAAGGNEKKAKLEVSCVGGASSWKSFVDSKGLTGFHIETVSVLLLPATPPSCTNSV